MAELAPKVVGFKCYFISGMESFTRVTHEDFARIVAEGERLGRPILLHAEDLDYVTAATARVKAARGGRQGRMVGLLATRGPRRPSSPPSPRPSPSPAAESPPSISSTSGRRPRPSSPLPPARAARPAPTTWPSAARTSPRRAPPSRPLPSSREGPSAASSGSLLASGAIDFLASDHAPSSREEKETGDVWSAYGGIPGWAPASSTSIPRASSEAA